MSTYGGVHIVRDPQIFGGRPIIGRHRISVHAVVTLYRHGETPETIAEDYELTLPEVQAALAYYHGHQEEIDREILEDQQEIARRAEADPAVTDRLRSARDSRDARGSHA